MSAAAIVAAERGELADLMLRLGPDAPTLCGGWTTRDLAAHLVVRERRPDAAPGILLPPFAFWTERVQGQYARRDYGDLVGLLRSGPPWLSLQATPPMQTVEVQEWTVHHEDARRGSAEWSPRPPDRERDDAVWRQVGLMGRIAYRRSPVGVTLRRPDGEQHVVRRGARTVVLTGEPVELLLHALGRDECVLHPEGEPADVAAVMGLSRGI